MKNNIFPWKRFWCHINGSITTNMRGFVYDPEINYLAPYHEGVLGFEEINEKSAVFFLGEPGSGKSTTIKKDVEIFIKNNNKNGNLIIHEDLSGYSNEQGLIKELFYSDEIEQWKQGNNQLYYFLDSLDECMLNIPNISAILLKEIYKLKDFKERLNIRIICRTTKLPNSLVDGFSEIWNSSNSNENTKTDSVGIYELIPLREKDIKLAVEMRGIDEDKFIADIIRKEIQPLASYPITLNFLINIYQQNKSLPVSKTELYNKGCKILCSENNKDRVLANDNYLSSNRALALASRIAAFMFFCNKKAVSIYPDISFDNSLMQISSIEGEKEITDDQIEFSFTEKDLKEVVQQTALFSARGKDKYGFVHHSYMEYLAARYLIVHKLPLKQIKAIIFSKDNMVIPHFSGVASWLISLDSKIRELVIENNPLVILDSDVHHISEDKHEKILENLLKQFEDKLIIDTIPRLYFKYYKLNYPGIEQQLKNYIKNKNKHFMVRRVAIDIAETCKVKELQEILLTIVFDTSEKLYTREQAVHALSKIADRKTCLELIPLIKDDFAEDKRDEIKGAILTALWPKHISTKKVFDLITPGKKSDFYGKYFVFLTQFAKNLKSENLDIALEWMKEQFNDEGKDLPYYKQLKNIILFRSWDYLDEPKIMEAFVKAIIPRINNFKDICPLSFGYEEKKIPHLKKSVRKKLILKLIENHCENLHMVIVKSPKLLLNEDLEWMVNYFIENSKSKNCEIWLDLINRLFKRDDPEYVELIYKNMSKSKDLLEKFKDIFEAIEINSDKAQRLKEDYNYIKVADENRNKRDDKERCYETERKINELMNKYGQGRVADWWKLCYVLSYNKKNPYTLDEYRSDIRKSYGWEICDQSMREEIVKWAREYIMKNEVSPKEWLENNIYYRPVMAGYKALILLKNLDPLFLDTLSPDIWSKWAEVILGYPESYHNAEQDNFYFKLIEQAYHNSPDGIINTLSKIIDKENKEHKNLFILHKVESINDNKLNSFLLEKVKGNSLNPKCFYTIISFLIKNNFGEAIDYAKSYLTDPVFSESDKAYVKYTALSLLNYTEDATWDYIWPLIQKDNEFGKELLLSFSFDTETFNTERDFVDKITSDRIAKLYILLCKYFPREEDPDISEVHIINGRESVVRFRNDLLKYLEQKCAVKSLQYIKDKLPNNDIIDFYLIEARRYKRELSWYQFSTKEFSSMIKTVDSYFIYNEKLLIEAIISSLHKMESLLQGETPLAFMLWDKVDDKYRPKSENDLSDFIKVHLKEELDSKGIVALREVEIRRRKSKDGISGERTDIYVTGSVPNLNKQLKVIIEVKGCWHSEVNKAMETQLLNRYLGKRNCNYGLYIVGWFCCKQWDKNDSRSNRITTTDIEEVRELLKKQAETLSNGDKLIKSYVLDCSLK